MSGKTNRLLVAASGTGGHLFPALAVAEALSDYEIEWLGVPNRLETQLLRECYHLNNLEIQGFQQGLSFKSIKITLELIASVFQVRRLIKQKKIDAIFTTGGYIAAPAILAALLEKKPAILHESNFIPGKVTRFLSKYCSEIAIGFAGTSQYLPNVKTEYVSTPVRSQFLASQHLDLPIPPDAFLLVVVGGSQGAVAVNDLVRQAAPKWLDRGIYIVHLTGKKDPRANSLEHEHYISLPFYENMAGLFQRANLAISRAGAGTLTELAITKTPAILIPYPYAAEDHQTFNSKVFSDAGAAIVYQQSELTPEILESQIIEWLNQPDKLSQMATQAESLAMVDSAEKVATLIKSLIELS